MSDYLNVRDYLYQCINDNQNYITFQNTYNNNYTTNRNNLSQIEISENIYNKLKADFNKYKSRR